MIYSERIAPTVKAIDDWMAQEAANKPTDAVYANDYDQYGVNIWTKASQGRCITSRATDARGAVWYWTIRGEGSSNGSREYAIRADKITRAEAYIVGERDSRFQRASA